MKALAICLIALVVAGCSESPKWKGWVYPDGSDLTRHIPLGAFETVEQCRNSARPILANFNLVKDGEAVAGDYECGYKCKEDKGLGGLNVCEKTER